MTAGESVATARTATAVGVVNTNSRTPVRRPRRSVFCSVMASPSVGRPPASRSSPARQLHRAELPGRHACGVPASCGNAPRCEFPCDSGARAAKGAHRFHPWTPALALASCRHSPSLRRADDLPVATGWPTGAVCHAQAPGGARPCGRVRAPRLRCTVVASRCRTPMMVCPLPAPLPGVRRGRRGLSARFALVSDGFPALTQNFDNWDISVADPVEYVLGPPVRIGGQGAHRHIIGGACACHDRIRR
jgi:hypothetical protein